MFADIFPQPAAQLRIEDFRAAPRLFKSAFQATAVSFSSSRFPSRRKTPANPAKRRALAFSGKRAMLRKRKVSASNRRDKFFRNPPAFDRTFFPSHSCSMQKGVEPQMNEPKRDGFLALYQRNIGRVYQICRLHLKNNADAEDAAQSVFLNYWKTKPQFRDEEHEKAWFIVAARNQSRDMLRAWWRCHRADSAELETAAHWDSPEDGELLKALLALPSRCKDVMYLYYYEGYSSREIANMLECTESAVRSQLCEGRKKLKISLGGDYAPAANSV